MMGDTIWMDFSGAPPLLLPRSALALWRGFYIEWGEADGSADLVCQGRAYAIHSSFDFAQPASDYERLCAWQLDAANQGIRPYPLTPAHLGIAIADESDGAVGWCAALRLLITSRQIGPTAAQLGALTWERAFTYAVAEPLVLMNACLFGADPDMPDGQWCEVSLAPGAYAVEQAALGSARLYRFAPLD